MSSSSKARGFTLIEVIVVIVVMAVAIVGVLATFETAVRTSVDPQVRKQMLAIAESMLDEVLLSSFAPLPGAGWPAVPRSGYDDVADYHNFTTGVGGMRDIQGNLVNGLGAYNVTVTVAAATLNGVAAARLVTVTVTGPSRDTLTLDGYRVSY